MPTWPVESSPQPMPAATSTLSAWQIRVVGSLIGASVPALAGAASAWLGIGIEWLFVLGVLPGLLCGGFFATEAVGRGPVVTAIKAAFVGVSLIVVPLAAALLLVFGTMATASIAQGAPTPDRALWSPALILVWVAVVTIVVVLTGYGSGPMVGLPSAFVAVAVLRRVVRMRPLLAAATSALLVLAAVLSSAVAVTDAVALRGWNFERASRFELVVSPVDLDWTVVNRSPRSYMLTADSTGGANAGRSAYVPGCQESAGVWALGSDWSLRLEPEVEEFDPDDWPEPAEGTDLPEPPPPLARPSAPTIASSVEFPGSTVRLRLEVSPNGAISVVSESELPSQAGRQGVTCTRIVARIR